MKIASAKHYSFICALSLAVDVRTPRHLLLPAQKIDAAPLSDEHLSTPKRL
jgi:hypothetical protein